MQRIRMKNGKRYIDRKTKKRLFVIGMLSIPTVHFIVFWLWINLDSILLAFQNNIGEWVGWTNIKWVFNAFTSNPYLDMWEATKNTLIFFVWNVFVELPIAVLLAYVFYKKLPGGRTSGKTHRISNPRDRISPWPAKVHPGQFCGLNSWRYYGL